MGGPRRRGASGPPLYPPASGPSLYPPASGPRSPAWSGLATCLVRPRPRPDPRPALPCLVRPRPRPDPRPALPCLVQPRPRPGPRPALPCLVRPRPRPRPRPDPRPALLCLVRPDLRPALPCLVRPRPRSAMWLCTDQSCTPVTNVARNSPPHISDFEIGPLELQRLWAISKNDRVKLRATFAGTVTAVTFGPLYRPREPRPRLATTNSFTKNRCNHHENLQSAAHPRPHGPLAVSLAAVCVSGLPCDYVLISHARQSPMSHVIPLHIFQTLKSDR